LLYEDDAEEEAGGPPEDDAGDGVVVLEPILQDYVPSIENFWLRMVPDE